MKCACKQGSKEPRPKADGCPKCGGTIEVQTSASAPPKKTASSKSLFAPLAKEDFGRFCSNGWDVSFE